MPRVEKTAGGQQPLKRYQKSGGVLVPRSPIGTATSAPSSYAPDRVWDFQTGDLTQWRNTHGTAPTIVTTSHPLWPKAAKFTVDNNTRATFDDSTIRRTEMASDGNGVDSGSPVRGTRQHWGWTTWFPTNLVSPAANSVTGGWLSWLQFRPFTDSDPALMWFNIAAGSNPPMLRLQTIGATHDLGTVPTNRADAIGNVVDVYMDVTWHDNPSLGRVAVTLNGVQVLDTACQNLISNGSGGTQAAYVKQGGYGSRYSSGTTPNPSVILHHAGLRRGPTLASITR